VGGARVGGGDARVGGGDSCVGGWVALASAVGGRGGDARVSRGGGALATPDEVGGVAHSILTSKKNVGVKFKW
jgi:hypothetical protein